MMQLVPGKKGVFAVEKDRMVFVERQPNGDVKIAITTKANAGALHGRIIDEATIPALNWPHFMEHI